MGWIKNTLEGLTSKLQDRAPQHGNSIDPIPTSAESVTGRLAWPPRLTCPPHILGEVKDISGREYPRDLGRSVELGGQVYYIFGDTFCFDNNGEFVGVTNNST